MKHERGAATMLAIGIVAISALLVLAASRLGDALTARARAETAADAAALAAADSLALGRGVDDASVQARAVAGSNGARLVECDCGGDAAEVVVEVDGAIVGDLPRPARARARAEVDRACALSACDEGRVSPRSPGS